MIKINNQRKSKDCRRKKISNYQQTIKTELVKTFPKIDPINP
jgi:hypothetical protein